MYYCERLAGRHPNSRKGNSINLFASLQCHLEIACQGLRLMRWSGTAWSVICSESAIVCLFFKYHLFGFHLWPHSHQADLEQWVSGFVDILFFAIAIEEVLLSKPVNLEILSNRNGVLMPLSNCLVVQFEAFGLFKNARGTTSDFVMVSLTLGRSLKTDRK